MSDRPVDVIANEVGAHNARVQVRWVRQLQTIRIQRGLTPDDVAERMGVDVAQVYRFESGGTNFTMSTAYRYSKAIEATWNLEAISADAAAD